MKRLDQIFEPTLTVINDSGRIKVLGKLKTTEKFFKKSPKNNIEIGRLEKIAEEVVKMIKESYDVKRLSYMLNLARKGIRLSFSIESLELAVDLYNSYSKENMPEYMLYDSLEEAIGNEIVLLNVGKSSSGKSALIKSLINKLYWFIFNIIVGMRETSTFENVYHLVSKHSIVEEFSSLIDEDVFSIKPTFKTADEVDELIQNNALYFIERVNREIFTLTKTEIDEELSWNSLIKVCLPFFTNDTDRVFNIELLVGKLEQSNPNYDELLHLMSSMLTQLERKRLNKQSALFETAEEILAYKLQSMKSIHNESDRTNELFDELIVQFNKIILNDTTLDDLKILVFRNILDSLGDKLSLVDDNELKKASTLQDLKSVYDKITLSSENTFITLNLPSQANSRQENSQIRKNTTEMLNFFYANSKQIKAEKKYGSPLINKMEVWLPYNKKYENYNLNFKIIDTIGLDHGENITPTKLSNRTINYINKYTPDLVLLNINITEKQDQLQYVVESIKSVGYLERTLFLAGHVDEVMIDVAKKEFLNIFTEEKDVENIAISSAGNELLQSVDYDVLSIINELSNDDQQKIYAGVLSAYFCEILDIAKKNFIIDQMNASIKVPYSKFANNLIIIDRIDNLSSIIGDNDLMLEKIHEVLFSKIIELHQRNLDISNTNKNDILLEVDMSMLYQVISNLVEEYLSYERNLYSRDNNDLRWNTVNCGLYELKLDRPGLYYGTSYDITPGNDFAATFIKGIMLRDDEVLYQLNMNSSFDDDMVEILNNRFKSCFSKAIYDIAHIVFITNYKEQYSKIYNVRYGERMYYTLPMTSERKLRMKDILTNIGSQREQIELIVRTAFATAAEQLDISHDIKFR